MPYGRRSFGSKRRTNRTFRKKGRTLRSSNILTRKSASAQSRQILALKRKVNAIAYANRPEVKIWDTGFMSQLPWHRIFNNSAISRTHEALRMYIPDLGSEEGQRIGNTFKVISHQWLCSLRYSNDSATGFHANIPSCAVVRLTVVQFKTDKFDLEGVPPISDIFSYYHTSQEQNYSLITDSPFVPGFSNEHRILYDKKYFLTPDKPIRDVVVNVHPKHNLVNIPVDIHGGDASESKNVMAMYITVGNLLWDANFKENVDLFVHRKIAYTDS